MVKMSNSLGKKAEKRIRYCNFFVTPPKGYVFALNTTPNLNHNTMGAINVGAWLISTNKKNIKNRKSISVELETKEQKGVN